MELETWPVNVLSSDFSTIDYARYGLLLGHTARAVGDLRHVETQLLEKGFLVCLDSDSNTLWTFKPRQKDEPPGLSADVPAIIGSRCHLIAEGVYEPVEVARSQAASTIHTLDHSKRKPATSTPQMADATVHHARKAIARHEAPLQASLSHEAKPNAIANDCDSPDLHALVLSAVLSSIVFSLCRREDYVALNTRTLAKHNNAGGWYAVEQDQGCHVVDLDVCLSSLGRLILKAATTHIAGLRTWFSTEDQDLSPKLSPAPIWLAPLGIAAWHYGPEDGDSWGRLLSSTIQKNVDPHIVRSEDWKQACREWIFSKGLDWRCIAQGWSLVRVTASIRTTIKGSETNGPIALAFILVAWPTSLCYRSLDTHAPETAGAWSDPVAFAEQWFTGKSERERFIAKEIAELKEAQQAMKQEMNKGMPDNIATALHKRRPSNSHAVYPTPPDALHVNASGATPNMDGTGTTPLNPQIATSRNAEARHDSIDRHPWDSSERVPSPDIAMIHDQPDTILHDLNEDPFADTDLTDADFNFFDEPTVADAPTTKADAENSSMTDMPAINHDADSSKPERPHQSEDSLPDLKEPLADTGDVQISSTVVPQTSLKSKGTMEVSVDDTLDEQDRDGSSSAERIALFEDIVKSAQRRISNQSSLPPDLFKKLSLPPTIQSIDSKYLNEGRFAFATKDSHATSGVPLSIPRSPYLKFHQWPKRSAGPGLSALNGSSPASSYVLGMQSPPESDASSESSEMAGLDAHDAINASSRYDDNMQLEKADSAPAVYSTPKPNQFLDTEDIRAQDDMPARSLLKSDYDVRSLRPFLDGTITHSKHEELSDVEYMDTAQILADQAITCPWLGFSETTAISHSGHEDRSVVCDITDAMRDSVISVTTHNIRSYIDIPGVPALTATSNQTQRPLYVPRSLPSDKSKHHNPIALAVPHILVKRAESDIALTSPSVPFWDTLGLSPFGGTKDVVAICLHPELEGVALRSNSFMEQMRSAYESRKLGTHTHLESERINLGLTTYPTVSHGTSQRPQGLANLNERIVQLASEVNNSSCQSKNVVIYIICDSEVSPLPVHICSAFKHMFDSYSSLKPAIDGHNRPQTEIIPQLVPLSFVAASDHVPVPPPAEYNRLAMQIYDRAIDFNAFTSEPAIILEPALPKSIDFKLTTEHTASLLHENTCLHVAYAQSLDDRWISAAWTDNQCRNNMTASYCLGRDASRLTMQFEEVAKEIWETTLDVTRQEKITWRVLIVKSGVMEASEIATWQKLASTATSANITMTLLTARSDSTFRVLPDTLSSSPLATDNTNTIITPITTPSATTVASYFPGQSTPDTSMREAANASSTEAGYENDLDARLIDITDQTWAVVLSHRLSNSNSLMDERLALISGYLIKRGGAQDNDIPVILEVNIIHSDIVGNPRTYYDGLLREVLGYYRGLALLARLRRITDPVRSTTPWHVAAVERMVAALYRLM